MIDFDHNDMRDDYESFEMKQLKRKLESCQDWLIGLYEQLSSNKPLSIDAVREYMDEMAFQLDINEKAFGELTIERKAS